MRMILSLDGKMSVDSIELREFSCCCQNCMIGGECENVAQIQNPWRICQIVLKDNILPVPPLAVVGDIINNDIEGNSDDDNEWDFWEN